MLRRVVIGACFACLMGGTAYAVDENAPDNECTEQLSQAEDVVNDKIEANAFSEDDANKVNELLDEAEADCNAGDFKEAEATLATVNKMAAKAKPTAQPDE
jgi:hypothetical protein